MLPPGHSSLPASHATQHTLPWIPLRPYLSVLSHELLLLCLDYPLTPWQIYFQDSAWASLTPRLCWPFQEHPWHDSMRALILQYLSPQLSCEFLENRGCVSDLCNPKCCTMNSKGLQHGAMLQWQLKHTHFYVTTILAPIFLVAITFAI